MYQTTILSILNELASTTKRLEKESILKTNKENLLLKKVFRTAYNPDLTFWIQKTPEKIPNNLSIMDLENLESAIDSFLEQIASRKITGLKAIDLYQTLLSSLSQDDSEVLERIISRDLRCGVNVPTINKIWPGLIPTYDLMLAETDPKKLKFPCYVQTKYDGIRILITRTLYDTLIIRTRNGKQITSLETLSSYFNFKQVIQKGETWDGELVCWNEEGLPLSRKESNGILNSAIRNTITPEQIDFIVFHCWDIVDTTQTIPYKKRLETMYSRFEVGLNKKIKPIETSTVSSIEEVNVLFNKAIQEGEEGVIAKNIESVWQPKRTFDLVKFKAEKTADLLVVGVEEGLGKNVGKLGALVCQSSEGLLQVNVGTGFSDVDREELFKNKPLGKIVEIKYNARITKSSGGVDSLYLPRFSRFRDDEKTEANSLTEIL